MASILAAALPFLMSSGGAAGAAGGLSGLGGLANILGGGSTGLGSLAGSTMAGGMQGPTQGSGIMGMLSGGNYGDMSNIGMGNNSWQNPDIKTNAAAPLYTPPKQLGQQFLTGVTRTPYFGG